MTERLDTGNVDPGRRPTGKRTPEHVCAAQFGRYQLISSPLSRRLSLSLSIPALDVIALVGASRMMFRFSDGGHLKFDCGLNGARKASSVTAERDKTFPHTYYIKKSILSYFSKS